MTIVPIFSVTPPPVVSVTASSSTTFRKASYPRNCPVTLRLPLRDNFNFLSCEVYIDKVNNDRWIIILCVDMMMYMRKHFACINYKYLGRDKGAIINI